LGDLGFGEEREELLSHRFIHIYAIKSKDPAVSETGVYSDLFSDPGIEGNDVLLLAIRERYV
jgi:hypothetical protein